MTHAPHVKLWHWPLWFQGWVVNSCKTPWYRPVAFNMYNTPISVLITCPPGTYKNGSECGVCSMGTYQPSPMSEDGTCTPCDPGSYCMYQMSGSVTGPCQAGYYCPEGSTQPNEKLCPVNNYCPSESLSPLRCPHGSVSQNGETSALGCTKERKLLIRIVTLHYLSHLVL